MNRLLRCLITVLFFITACPVLSSAQNIVLRGCIKDSATQEPIPYAPVVLQDSTSRQYGVFSDQSGNYKFSNVPKGIYTLEIYIIGHKSLKMPVTITGGNPPSTVNVTLPKSAINISQVTITGSTQDIGQTMNVINQMDLLLRPVNSAQDLMRLVPGLFLAQHQGGGKAEQIFLRGFDADHGTDFAVFWDGIPVNMPSHAHGQGYADSHFMIPETIDQLNVYKGTYTTQFGDFATAGAAAFTTKNFTDNMFKVEYGSYGYRRVTGTLNLLGKNGHLFSKYRESAYISVEGMYNAASYFVHPQDYVRTSIFGKYYGQISKQTTLTIEGSYFQATWNGSGQIPLRAISEGIITRFGALDPSEGGQTDRTNANVILKTALNNGAVLKNQVYYSFYQLNLYTDFTFFLVDTVHGDGINQRDNGRNIFGYNGSYEVHNKINHKDLKTVIGLTTKADMGQLALRHQEDRVILDTVSMGNLYEQSAAAYIDETYHFTDKLFVNAGVRADYFYFQYTELGHVIPTSLVGFPQPGSGIRTQPKVSPKLNLYYDLNSDVQFFIRSGYGFHSNDARVAVNSSTDPLPTALGYEAGSTFKPFSGMVVNAVLWGIHLQNELTYDQDVAQDVVNGPTQRYGADLSVRYQIYKFIYFDIDLNYSHGRFTDSAAGHNYIPLAPTFTSVAGITVKGADGFSGSLRYRDIDDRPANSENTVTAYGYFLVDAMIKYKVKKYEFALQCENIFNVAWNEAQFDTVTRLPGEPLAGIDQLCFTPGAPRLFKGSVAYYF